MAQTVSDITIDIAMRLNRTELIKNFNAIRSSFSGSSFPSSPANGQKAFVDNKLYQYNGATWDQVSLGTHSHNDLYYTKTEVNAQLSNKVTVGSDVSNTSRVGGWQKLINCTSSGGGLNTRANYYGGVPSLIYVNAS